MKIVELLADQRNSWAVANIIVDAYSLWMIEQLPADARVVTLGDIQAQPDAHRFRGYMRVDVDKYIASEYWTKPMIEFKRYVIEGKQRESVYRLAASFQEETINPKYLDDLEIRERATNIAKLLSGLSLPQVLELLEEGLVQWATLTRSGFGHNSVFHALDSLTEF